MRRQLIVVGAASLVVALAGCRTAGRGGSAQQRASDTATLLHWMTGSFSSAAQAAADPEHYYEIHLHMVPIWTARDDGPWLYVEQAAATKPDHPYRQRVYRLVPHQDGTVESAVYTLPDDPLRFAGAWRDPARLDELTPADLTPRTGCSIFLRRVAEDRCAGQTRGQRCKSTLRGAAYATAQAEITPTTLRSWDRGYAADGTQVWGATEGPYVFRKQP